MPIYLSDTEWILVILAGIYLAECFCWLPGEATCFCSLGRRHYPLRSPTFLGNGESGLVFTNPLPSASSLVCEFWPATIAADGICLPDRGAEPGRYVALQAIRSIEADERKIHLNGHCVAKLASAYHARDFAAMLQELAAMPASQREQAIDDRLREATDTEAIRRRIAELKSRALPLRMAATALFVCAFVFGPILYYGLPSSSPLVVCVYLLGFLGVWAWAVASYFRLRRFLFAETFRTRLRHSALAFFSPASLMRAGESLLRHSLAAYHPLAVAAVVCSRNKCEAIAQQVLLGLRHSRPADIPSDPLARRVHEWFQARLLARLEEMLRHVAIEPVILLQPPDQHRDTRSYCPRCHNQYVLAEGCCADCAGVRLEPFAAEPAVSSVPASPFRV